MIDRRRGWPFFRQSDNADAKRLQKVYQILRIFLLLTDVLG
jgi:hypothetical protein